jgi:manganese oxidase
MTARLLRLVATLTAVSAGPTLGQVPAINAVPNDQRTPAGRLVDGEWHVELEALEAQWRPRGPEGPTVLTPVFAEAGGPPMVPGPLLRFPEGVPVRITVRNRLQRPIEVRGLNDRASAPEPGTPAPPPGVPAFFFAAPLPVAPGDSATVRFTPTREVSSFYFARLVPPPGTQAPRLEIPGGIADEGSFMGGFVVDPQGTAPHPDERVFLITRWGSPEEPGSLNPTWKMMMNGLSWPHTERLHLTVGDTARWRVINASAAEHPMHLHGFYFRVEATGDTQADTVFAPEDRRDVVTEMMQEYAAVRLSWVPERPGNWLFHCHLIRHMGELQRFQAERVDEPDDGHGHNTGTAEAAAPDHDMDMMAGLIVGITVSPRPGEEEEDPSPARRLDLWTGASAGVFGDLPELGFVLQDGAGPPTPDSVVVPGSPLVLRQGEPTEIVVHNRLDFPLSVHWHGLELRSLYDGVGGWSGNPGSVRPPIPPGSSQRVVIEPVRSGTFFYHTHGEPGHELSQGLYGPFLVLGSGESWDRDRDRVFVLGSRGAELDAPPAVNGQVRPAPESFEPGETYRLRFAHISPDEFKEIRLLRDGEPVAWTPLAKDGADLPPRQRTPGPAQMGMGVGEAYDFLWTPEGPGVHVLEVRTEFYPSLGGSVVQRMAFAVGDATDEEVRAATTGTELDVAELTAEERRAYVGTFQGPLVPDPAAGDWILGVWEGEGGLHYSMAPTGALDPDAEYLIPLGADEFTPGRFLEGLMHATALDVVLAFRPGSRDADAVRITQGGEVVFNLERVAGFSPGTESLAALEGVYSPSDAPVEVRVRLDAGETIGGPGLLLTAPQAPEPSRLVPLTATRFLVSGGGAPPGTLVVFDILEDGTGLFRLLSPGQPALEFLRQDAPGGK